MNGIEMATTIRDMCHTWQINRGLNTDAMTGAFVLYDFMKARGEDVSLAPAVVTGFDSGKSKYAITANIIVSFKSDIGEMDLVDACEYSSNLEFMRYFTRMAELKAWMDGEEDGDVMPKEKQKEVVEEYMSMMKLSLRVRSKDSVIREFRTEKYKEMKAYVEDEYKKYIMGFIKTAITTGGVKLPFTEFVRGVMVISMLIINPSKMDDDATVMFACPYLSGRRHCDQIVFSIGVDVVGPRSKKPLSTCEIFGCLERIMTIFHTVKYDKLHGFNGGKGFKIRNDPVIVPNIDDICCVCHDPCLVKTKCSHTMCLQCWGSIITTKYSEEKPRTDAHINCPMCRQELKMVVEELMSEVDKLD